MNTWLNQHRLALVLALRRLAATPLGTLLAVLAIGIALSVPAGGQMLLGNATQLARDATPTPQLSLYLDGAADRRAAQEIEARLRTHALVKSLRFIPRDETLARMKRSEGLAEVIDALPKNPFPDAFAILPKDERPETMERLAAELRTWPRIEHVQLDSTWVRRLDVLIRLARSALVVLAILFGAGLVAVTFNTIRLQIATRRVEIEVSRLLGATDAFVRRPFQYFGAIQGLLSGIAACVIVGVVTVALQGPIAEFAQAYGLAFTLRPLAVFDTAALLAAAAGLGWLGATLSVRQTLAGA